ncbi:hypothetical protein FOQG_15722 [Fusarium oxysporum f. sp. raphani 54005]|uniref:Uncharacterized protein n=1 Tax=Fusarium oxysporum f. sp. raphani 54005 TaxID=1089458 RepID=X0CAK8_FUSOX|nr:hypothetical protein FOQG_15722 [Fusarium oxysporum f. sp. raphani 54005]
MTGKRAGKRAGKRTGKRAGKWTGKRAGKWTGKRAGKWTGKWTDKWTGKEEAMFHLPYPLQLPWIVDYLLHRPVVPVADR